MARAVEDLESEYNVRLLHPQRTEFHRRGVQASESTYKALPCIRDIRYAEGRRALMDVFPAKDTGGPAAVVAFFHGGYWHAHERQEFAYVARCFGSAGIATAIVGYDLAPEATMARIVEQARMACAWLKQHASKVGADADLVFAAGHSAGAHLAACALTGNASATVRGAVLVSGIYSLSPLLSTTLNEKIGLTRDTARRWSPAHHALPPSGDILVAVGAFETGEFLRQSRAFADKWRGAQRESELMLIPAAHHYSIPLELADPASALSRAAIHRVLATSATSKKAR